MNFWLFKSEPDAFSIDNLKAMKGKTDHWDGIRNYQARNLMRDEIKKGDKGFFYHSSCKIPGIVGELEVVKEAYPDYTAWDPESSYYDPKCSAEDPRWVMVDVKFRRKYKEVIPLQHLRDVKGLDGMVLLRKGSRLSVQPVTKRQWDIITKMN